MDSSAAMSITELFEISTLFVSSLKPPPRYKRVEPMVCGSCSSWLHVLHKKFRSPALLAETEKNSCGSGALYCSLTSNSLAFLSRHTYAIALKTQANWTISVTAEVYNLGAIRYILQKISQVSPCNISKCFIPLEAPVPYIIHSIYYYCCLALLLWQMRHTVHLGLLFQGFHQTRLVPAALMLPSSLNNDGGHLAALVVANKVDNVDI